MNDYQKNVEGNYPTLDDRDFDRKTKKFKKLETKALNLNLDDPISIRQTCDPKREIDDEKLMQIAEIISSDYHD